MSQSPINDFSDRATLRYKQGWRALNRLLHEDRSFSGNERHCAFVNTGGTTASFADVSGVTGFDFAEDGRGLATADWDFDGDPDLWITNRTAPRIRFLRNNTDPPEDSFVAFKLIGDGRTSNRDAIGARLNLHLSDGAAGSTRIETLRGGEGFLSQSSNWIHFALGDATSIEKLVVRWPGAEPQEFSDLQPGRFYLLQQGNPSATQFTPPAERRPLAPSEQVPAPPESAARIIVPPGLIVPEVPIASPDGGERLFTPPPGQATLLNVWASWCAPCLIELREWTEHADSLESAGLHVIALDTDPLGPDPAPTGKAEQTLQQIGFPFASETLTEDGLKVLDQLQISVLDRWTPIPLPTSFLVDQQGEVIAIYKGQVESSQILADLKLASASPLQRRQAAVPFAGRWVDDTPARSDPKRVATGLLDHNEQAAAIRYLDRIGTLLAPKAELPGYSHQLGDIYYTAAILKSGDAGRRDESITDLSKARDLIPHDLRIRKELAKQLFGAGQLEAAATEMKAAVQINPDDLTLQGDLAIILQKSGDHPGAKSVLESLLAKNPKNAPARYYLAASLVQLGDHRAAIEHYRQTLRDAPRMLDAANNLAWLLATNPVAEIRAPEEAIALAQRLCQVTQEKNAAFLDTLSVALASSEKFPEAIEAANKALALIPAESELADQIRRRVEGFEANKPYIE